MIPGLLAHGSEDPFGFPMFLLLLAIIVIAVVSQARASFRSRCRRVAEALGGRYDSGGLLGRPAIRFSIEGFPARIQFGHSRDPYTSVRVDLPGQVTGTLKIIEEGFAQSLLKLLGAQDLSIGDPVFDAQYVIKATPPALVESVFSPARRQQVMTTVRRLNRMSHPKIELARQVLEVRVRENLKDEELILAVARAAREFAGYLLEPGTSTGIQWIESRTGSAARCPVCRTGLEGAVIRCDRCDVPHHEDCWSYLGHCSVYGCAGVRSRRRAS